MSVKVDVEGEEEIYRLIAQIAEQAPIQLDALLEETAYNIRDDAREFAPVKTGRLRRNIVVQRLRQFHYYVVSKAKYSIYVEFGTWKMHARPFLRMAYHKNIEPLRARLSEFLMNLW